MLLGKEMKLRADLQDLKFKNENLIFSALLVHIYFALLVRRYEVMGRPAESQIWSREGQCRE